MNNSESRIMNKKFKTAASVVVTFALVLTTIITPATTAIAVTQLDSQFGFDTNLDLNTGFDLEFESNLDLPDLTLGDTEVTPDNADSTESGVVYSESESSFTECVLEASRNMVTIGESITLSWDTTGFDTITINGDSVLETSGSQTIHNLQERTEFTLRALSENGSQCVQQVVVDCEPPEEPEECKLDVDKEVNKSTAVPGEELTYTITVKNTGDADCTGGGVRIEDVVDTDLTYLRHNLTSNLSAGYGSDPVYTNSDRTLHFNGHVLEPGESGTITWVGKVAEPTECGDFEVTNQAKATAVELDNFQTWAYSNTVRTAIDNDCPVPDDCELEVLKSVNKSSAVVGDELTYTITVENTGDANCTGSGVLIEDVVDDNLMYLRHELSSNVGAGYVGQPVYTSSDRTLHFNGYVLEPAEVATITWVGKVTEPTECGDFEVTNQAKATALELNNFQTWAYSEIVRTAINNDCEQPKVPECTLTPATQTVEYGGTANLNWTTAYADTVTLTDFGSVGLNGSVTTGALFADTGYTLTATGEGGEVTCQSLVEVGEPADEFATVVAQKIVCSDEAELPNYGTGGPDMTEYTAIDWVDAHDSCELVSGWEFEWTDDQTNDPGDSLIGIAGAPWNAFGPTDVSGMTSVDINLNDLTNDRVWFREVLKEGYIPFTHGLNGGTNVDNVSAEFYCHSDVVNYDNRDFITGMQDGETYYCVAWNALVPEVPAPSCDMFAADPSAIMIGDSTTLSWETSNSVQAFLNNGIGAVDLDGSITVSPLADITYTLTVIGAEDQAVDCSVPVTVSEDPVPVCELFTATPDQLPVGGGNVTLNWEVLNATEVTILPTIGDVLLTGTAVLDVTESTTFVLTAVDANDDQVSCLAPVAVADPQPDPLTCEDNVSFSVSDASIERGDNTVLNWSTTDVDSVSISQINATTLSGSQTVSPSDDITYVLTATRGSESVSCPLSVDVSSGGGGGSVSPRCDLDISDDRIELGDEVTIEWDTSNAGEVTLFDDRGEILFTTDDYLLADKRDYYDGEITLRPLRDTEYTLLVERGSRERECEVDVEVEDSIVVIQTRDQQPLVAGISLSQVPYTGFEAGPFMTALFYILLVAWAAYITYFLVVRKRIAGGPSDHVQAGPTQAERSMKQAEEIRPDVFTASVSSPAAPVAVAPSNLPTGNIASDQPEIMVENPHQVDDVVVTELENRAHSQMALLSSDAVRHFVGTTKDEAKRNDALDAVIAEAKKTYPLEDGWIVINESRMVNLCEVCQVNKAASSAAPFIPATVPEGTGSLAEAIVTGNVVAAYDMIGNRPMFALADAAADLDALYRSRRGEVVAVSEMLKQETTSLSDEQIKNMISALTGALDGTYTDEASAVKMAIMKAVKESS
jgi:uncharacterized repeat protein (TIGR01451 family)